MSYWTYIHGHISIDTPVYFKSREDLEKYVKYAIDEINTKTGGITGSEGPARFYVNSKDYPSGSGPTGPDYCDAYITIFGSLRDRMFDHTANEFKAFIQKLRTYFTINVLLVAVNGYGVEEHKIFTNEDFDNRTLEDIDTSDGYDYDEENMTEEQKVKLNNKRDQLFRIQYSHFEKYFHKTLSEEDRNKIIWILDHLDIANFDNLITEVDKIDEYNLNDHYVEIRKERKLSLNGIERFEN